MVRRMQHVLPLFAMVSCTRTVAVDSPVARLPRADRVHLRSGERVKVKRVAEQTTDSVVIESDGGRRRIALAEIESVVVRDRWRGMAKGAAAGLAIGAAVGLGVGIYEAAATCDDLTGDGEDDDPAGLGALFCAEAYIIVPSAYALGAALVAAIPGALLGLYTGDATIYRHKPPLTIVPSKDGAQALWTIEF
jgi:hypothetical protein